MELTSWWPKAVSGSYCDPLHFILVILIVHQQTFPIYYVSTLFKVQPHSCFVGIRSKVRNMLCSFDWMMNQPSRLLISSLLFLFFFWSAPSPVVEDKRSLLYFKGMPRVKIIPLFLQQRGCKESFREKCVGSDNAFWLVRNETTRIRGLHCTPSSSPFFKGTSKGLNSLCSGLKFSI